MTSLDDHFADAANDGKKLIEGRRVEVFEKGELWEEEIVGEDKVVNGHGMRGFASLALCDIEVHAFVAYTM